MKVPKFTIDRAAWKHGIWGNSWRNWGYILAAFLALYAIEAGYFTGLLFAAKRIRGTQYMTLPSQYFGDFDRESLPVAFAFPEAQSQESFNRPEGCTNIDENIIIAGESFPKPTGAQKCTSTNNQVGWTLFPWVAETDAAGNFPGCAGAGGSTVLTSETSPAFSGDEVAGPAVVETACQNFVPANTRQAEGAGAPPAEAPSPLGE